MYTSEIWDQLRNLPQQRYDGVIIWVVYMDLLTVENGLIREWGSRWFGISFMQGADVQVISPPPPPVSLPPCEGNREDQAGTAEHQLESAGGRARWAQRSSAAATGSATRPYDQDQAHYRDEGEFASSTLPCLRWSHLGRSSISTPIVASHSFGIFAGVPTPRASRGKYT